jgi:phage/plasmid-like protein (TIGR03299 family)
MTATATINPPANRVNPYNMLGCEVKGLTDVQQILQAAGGDFVAYSAPSGSHPVVGIGDDGEPELGPFTENGMIDVYRDDTNEVIGTHGGGYQVIQYDRIVNLALEAAGAMAGDVTSVGIGDNGGTFYACIDLKPLTLDPRGVADIIDQYLVLFASHNARRPIAFMPSNIRRPCTNILPTGYARDKRGFTTKHTKNVAQRLLTVADALGIAQRARDLFVEQAETMMQTPGSELGLLRTVDKLWPAPKPGASPATLTKHDKRRETIRTIFKGQTCVQTLGLTKWAEYNALTEFMDHGRGLTIDKRAIAAIEPNGLVDKQKGKMLELCMN